MAKRGTRRFEVQTGDKCIRYPEGRNDAKLSGTFRGARAPTCTSPEACPPDSSFPDYNQVLQVKRGKPKGVRFACSRDFYDYFKSLKYAPGEHFYAIGLNNKNEVQVISKVAQGSGSEVQIDRRLVFGPLLTAGAMRFALIHQHPSGDPRPSPEDMAITRVLKEGGDLLGLALVDHVVVGDEGYVSLRDAGVIR